METLATTELRGIGTALPSGKDYAPIGEGESENEWAKKQLKQWLSGDDFAKTEFEEFQVNKIDLNLHVLRSVSFVYKVRRSREKQFADFKKRRMSYLERVIKGEDW